jgi:mono/diheme cytochrome c family protein
MKKFMIVAILVVLGACHSQKNLTKQPSVTPAAPAPASVSELQQGQEMFQANCGRCHKLPNPSAFNAQQWTKILEKMGPKARLTADQQQLVYKFVTLI